MLPQEFVSKLAAAADPARFDQREPLPSFAKAGIIIFHAFQRTCQRSGGSFGSQAKIDAKKSAFGVWRRKRFENLFAQTIEPFVVRSARRKFSFLAINEKKIDVGAVIELASAQFAEGQNGKLSGGRSEAVAKFRIPIVKHFNQTNLRELR